MKDFAELFKRYRLRAEFASLSSLADALAEEGYFYDLSIISRWQKGEKIPSKRIVLVTLIGLFIERESITSLPQANEFLESAGHGYLTEREQIFVLKSNSSNPQLFD